MPLAEDLLQQAEDLSTKDPKKPKQANLRRAVSFAYYALFHLLTADAGAVVVPQRNLRLLIQRAFQHGTMKQAWKSIGGGTLPNFLQEAGAAGVSSGVEIVANTFVELQQARHEADYNVNRRFVREDVQVLIKKARQAFQIWRSLKASEEKNLFLLSLLLWKQWEHLR